MTSYLRKYVTALASAKDYIAQWSSEHVFADEPLIVPFPTLAIYHPERQVWSVCIKAWVYLPFQSKSLKSYLPSLPKFITGRKNEGTVESKSDMKVDEEKKEIAHEVTKEIEKEKVEESITMDNADDNNNEDEMINENDVDDIYEDALGNDYNELIECQMSVNNGNLDVLGEEMGETIENPGRLGLFFVGNSVKVAAKSIINGVEHLLQPADESGFIEECLELSDEDIDALCPNGSSSQIDRQFDYEIQMDSNNEKPHSSRNFKCTIYIPSADGVSVISDIDDTVKISNVLCKRLLLKHTFYSYFKPVEGMNELYQKWAEQQCQFHYVSASPWQLYPALRCFLAKYRFPLGTMNLRKFSWSLNFFHATDSYKLETITQIIDSYPSRKYICVGDSGELDPEIYSKLYIKYPQSIIHIFIRDVCPGGVCLPLCAERFAKAFEGVPQERWTVFKHPKDLETDVKKLMSL